MQELLSMVFLGVANTIVELGILRSRSGIVLLLFQIIFLNYGNNNLAYSEKKKMKILKPPSQKSACFQRGPSLFERFLNRVI